MDKYYSLKNNLAIQRSLSIEHEIIRWIGSLVIDQSNYKKTRQYCSLSLRFFPVCMCPFVVDAKLMDLVQTNNFLPNNGPKRAKEGDSRHVIKVWCIHQGRRSGLVR